MKRPALSFEQTIQRVSQMRKLGLSVREAYILQHEQESLMSRFNHLLTSTNLPEEFSAFDRSALRAGFRSCWTDDDYETIVSIANKLPRAVLESEPLLLAYSVESGERLKERL